MSSSQNSKLYQTRQAGMSLVELMVAITLGLFLSYGAVQSFLSGKKAYGMQEAMSRIQETGRLAQEFIGYDIRRAGDYGCNSGDAFAASAADDVTTACTGFNMLNSPSDNRYNFSYAVYGIDNFSGTAPNYLNNPAPVAGTDILVVHVAQDIGVTTAAVPATALGTVNLDTGIGLAASNIVSIGSCAGMRIFQVSAATAAVPGSITAGGSTPGNRCANTNIALPQASQVRVLDTYFYYVGINSTTNRRSLYRQTLSHAQLASPTGSDELLEGVEDMQLMFGLDSDGDKVINSWVTPTSANISNAAWNDWDVGYCTNGGALTTCTASPDTNHDQTKAVRAVRFSLLVASADPVLDAEQKYSYDGNTYYGGNATAGSGDKRLRQIFTSTVAIRSMQQTQ
ncbi:MAG TPA: PilW family protein [Pseudomonadales bacterium]|nr:PilW family protein [Pseudomonadales bacterium]